MTAVPNKITGDVLESTELFKLLGTDTTGGNTGESTYTQIGSVAIPALRVSSFILVRVLAKVGAHQDAGGSPGTSTHSIDIRIGEAGSEASKKEFDPVVNMQADTVIVGFKDFFTALEFFYEPTSAEKTNGFNVLILGKKTDTGNPALGIGNVVVDDVFVVGV